MSAGNFAATWRLVSYRTSVGDQVIETMGPEPQGRLIYEASGRMMVHVADPRVRPFASGDPRIFTEAEGRAAVIDCIACFGTYTVRPAERIVVHHLEGASIPNWRGGDQVRYFEFSGNQLTLKTPPIVLGGQETIGALVWERLPA